MVFFGHRKTLHNSQRCETESFKKAKHKDLWLVLDRSSLGIQIKYKQIMYNTKLYLSLGWLVKDENAKRLCLVPALTHVDLKQIDYQIFLQLKWVYWRSTRNCNSRSRTMGSHSTSSHTARSELFHRGENEVGRAKVMNSSLEELRVEV